MPRRRRDDAPGRLHHISNGGLDGDPLFFLGDNAEKFLDLVTRAVADERIKVHAAVLMTTHFHLFLESVDGRISRTIQWITGQFGYGLNRNRDRKGYVHAGRFWSAPVRTWAYVLAVIAYIDWNPMAAGMVDGPFLHPFGSAVHHVADQERPPWLCGDLIDRLIGPKLEAGLSRTDAYVQTFGLDRRSPPGFQLVKARLEHANRGRDDLDWLLSADGRRMTSWLRRKARSKPRAKPHLPMTDAGSVHEAVAEGAARHEETGRIAKIGRRTRLWPVAEAGLLRDLAGLTYEDAAEILEMSSTHAQNRYRLHRRTLLGDEAYAAVLAELAAAALRKCFGPEAYRITEAIFRRRVRKEAQGRRGSPERRRSADFDRPILV